MPNAPQSPLPPGKRPTNVAELLQHMQSMPFAQMLAAVDAFRPRPTDIIIATFPKCGTTWMQQIVHGLRTRGSMEFEEISLVIPFMEVATVQGIELDADQVAEPRAFKTHLAWDDVPKGGRYICVIRDPGDALVSFYHFLDGSAFEKGAIDIDTYGQEVFLPGHAIWGTYGAHVRSWWAQRHRDDVLLLCFEDMKRDLPGTVRRVARFMGLDPDPSLLDVATRQASYDFMRQHVHQFDDHPLQAALDELQNLPPGEPMHKVRSGRVGERDRVLSAATRAALDEMWQRELAEPLGVASYDDLRAQVAALYRP